MSCNIVLLPIDILVHIFKQLDLPDLRNVMISCKTFNNLIKNQNTIWRAFDKYKLIIKNNENNRNSNLLWYDRCRISYNWCKGNYKSKVVIQNYIKYMPWLTYHNSEVLLVAFGSELHCYSTNERGLPHRKEALWRVDVPKIIRHDIRTNDISRFKVHKNLIVCGNRDGCVAVYEANNLLRPPRLLSHIKDCHEGGEVEVTAVEVTHNSNQCIVVTGSIESTNIKLYQLKAEHNEVIEFVNKDCNIQKIYLSENLGTKCLALNNSADKLGVGLSGNSKPFLIDVNYAKYLMTSDRTTHHRQALKDIIWHDENTIIFVTHSGYVQMLDIRSQKVVYTMMDPFQSPLYCVKSDGHHSIVVGSAEYSRCVLYDTRNRIHQVQMYFTQKTSSPVYSLDFDSTKLITAVDRGVGVLNFNIDHFNQQPRDYSHIFY